MMEEEKILVLKKKKGKEKTRLNAILIRLETWIEFGEENIGR